MENKSFPRCEWQEELCRRENRSEFKKKKNGGGKKIGLCETDASINSSSKYFNTVKPLGH